MIQHFMRWLGYGLIGAGIALLLTVGILWGYGQYEQALATSEVARFTTTVDAGEIETPVPTPTLASPAQPSPAVAARSDAVADTASSFVPDSLRFSASATTLLTPTSEAIVPTPTPRPIYPAERIVASSIHLDAKISESPIVNGEWVVPKFVAGHLQGTAQPLQGGNVVLSGHIQSIASGNVFANIAQLRPGSQVRLYTKGGFVTYQVMKVDTVKNTDLSVVAPSSQEKLTLITCTGTWLPLQHDYSERTVVIAGRI